MRLDRVFSESGRLPRPGPRSGSREPSIGAYRVALHEPHPLIGSVILSEEAVLIGGPEAEEMESWVRSAGASRMKSPVLVTPARL